MSVARKDFVGIANAINIEANREHNSANDSPSQVLTRVVNLIGDYLATQNKNFNMSTFEWECFRDK